MQEGDEYNRQITGGPSESFMSLENPEADGQIYSVAPAEGQKSLSIMTDKILNQCVTLTSFLMVLVHLVQIEKKTNLQKVF